MKKIFVKLGSPWPLFAPKRRLILQWVAIMLMVMALLNIIKSKACISNTWLVLVSRPSPTGGSPAPA